MRLLLAAVLAVSAVSAVPARAGCDELAAALKREVYARLGAEEKRAAGREVAAALTPGERAELLDLAARFNATPHGTPAQQADRIAWQTRARVLVRAAAARAGRGPRNQLESPYDAVFLVRDGRDGLAWVVAETRSLLVRDDGRPHATIWVHRLDRAHNPWRLINLGLMDDPSRDYASWLDEHGGRRAGPVEDFLRANLPADCR